MSCSSEVVMSMNLEQMVCEATIIANLSTSESECSQSSNSAAAAADYDHNQTNMEAEITGDKSFQTINNLLDATTTSSISDKANISKKAATSGNFLGEQELLYDVGALDDTRSFKTTPGRKLEEDLKESNPGSPRFPFDHASEMYSEFEMPSPKEMKFTIDGDQFAPESTSNPTFSTKKAEQDPVVCFVNKDGRITPSAVLQYVLDVDQPFDTVISCADGRLGAHRLVLASASPFIGSMFCSHNHRLGEVAVIILPDIRVSTMKVLLNFCYTGKVIFPKEDEQEIVETMQFLLMGELGELSKSEVVIQEPSNPISSPNNAAAEIPVQSTSARPDGVNDATSVHQREPDAIQRATPMSLSRTPKRKRIVDLLSSSVSSPSSMHEKDGDSSSSDNEEDNNGIRSGYQNKTGPTLSQTFSASSGESKSGSELPTCNYLIPANLGGKTKKLLCYHCPGAFKSVETLSTHLEDRHGRFLQSRKVEKSELAKLLDCDACKTKHSSISSASQCLSRSHRTRCYVCFDAIKVKKFEHHMRNYHSLEQRSGSCIVTKCNWCEAGIILQTPIDNKAMSGHCFNEHFKNIHYSSTEPSEDDDMMEVAEINDKKLSKCKEKPSSSSLHRQDDYASVKPAIASTSKVESSSKLATVLSTPGTSTSKQKIKIPTVLAMLQRASQKRKLAQQEAEASKVIKDTTNIKDDDIMKPPKRPRLVETKANQKQVARRTGKPIGFVVNRENLRDVVPRFSSRAPKSNKSLVNGSVMLDVVNLPKTFVQFRYNKNFILNECEWNVAEESSFNRQNKTPNEKDLVASEGFTNSADKRKHEALVAAATPDEEDQIQTSENDDDCCIGQEEAEKQSDSDHVDD